MKKTKPVTLSSFTPDTCCDTFVTIVYQYILCFIEDIYCILTDWRYFYVLNRDDFISTIATDNHGCCQTYGQLGYIKFEGYKIRFCSKGLSDVWKKFGLVVDRNGAELDFAACKSSTYLFKSYWHFST